CARKSPPLTESMKWISGESPSPLVLTAPLMPPCAHTECERRHGTNEKTSTSQPASAILMTVMRPASPPPTTMNRGFSLCAMCSSALHVRKRDQRRRPEPEQRHADQAAHEAGDSLRLGADGQAPMNGRVPQPVGEMEHRAGHAHDVDPKHLDTPVPL